MAQDKSPLHVADDALAVLAAAETKLAGIIERMSSAAAVVLRISADLRAEYVDAVEAQAVAEAAYLRAVAELHGWVETPEFKQHPDDAIDLTGGTR